MPKRAPATDEIDPVRSRLAASVATPVERRPLTQPDARGEPVEPAASQVEAVPQAPPAAHHNGTHAAVGEEAAPSPQQDSSPARSTPVSRRSEPRVLTVNRKFMVTPEEADQIDVALGAISRAFGSRVAYSQVSRAVWSIIAGADDTLSNHPRRGERLRVPSKGDHLAMAEYEQELADYLRAILKRS